MVSIFFDNHQDSRVESASHENITLGFSFSLFPKTNGSSLSSLMPIMAIVPKSSSLFPKQSLARAVTARGFPPYGNPCPIDSDTL